VKIAPCFAFVACVSSLAHSAWAEGSPQFELYGYETPDQGQPELTLWTAYVAKSSLPYLDQARTRTGLWAHSLEFEYGLTQQLSIAAYADFEQPRSESFWFTGTRISARYRLGLQRYTYLVDPAIYVEYVVPRASYGGEELELRVILEKYLGDFAVRFNPTFSKITSGPEVDRGVELGYAAGIFYRRLYAVQPAIEAFGSFGPWSDPDAFDQQQHRVFGALQFQFAHAFRWEVGAGLGLTSETDKVVLRSVLTFEPPTSIALSPSSAGSR
jgi:hypothetical protein